MTPRWRLEVEGLGKIEHAEVDVRPLTLFVGPNNTGKSYLASLLWGLVAMQGDLEPPEGPERDVVDAWLQSKLPREQFSGQVDLESDEIALFDDLFRAALTARASWLTTRIFNSESVRAGPIHFRNISGGRRLQLQLGRSGELYTLTVQRPRSGQGVHFRAKDALDERLMPMARDMLMRHAVFGRLVQDAGPFEDRFSEHRPIYLPASRAGFMQLYKGAVRRGFEGAFRPEEAKWLDLTTPAYHFIDMIAFGLRVTAGGFYTEEADFLERQMTGRIELIDALSGKEYLYHPAGTAVQLTMKLSSALVTELAPLILVLRHLSNFPALVLEEPEAHLHPEVQRRLAQVIVRLIRKGLIIWITTHSDHFCQEVNNFIKLGALPLDKRAEAQQKLGYGPQDFLELDDVSGYEFKPDASGERSTVLEMKRTEAGLVMPTFNRAIVRLSQDVAYLDSLLSGDDP